MINNIFICTSAHHIDTAINEYSQEDLQFLRTLSLSRDTGCRSTNEGFQAPGVKRAFSIITGTGCEFSPCLPGLSTSARLCKLQAFPLSLHDVIRYCMYSDIIALANDGMISRDRQSRVLDPEKVPCLD